MEQHAWEDEDPMAPAKGIIRAMLIGAAIWLMIIAGAWSLIGG